MARRISTILNVSLEQFEATGAFDGFVDVDSRLHVDPHLLDASATLELHGARQTFDSYFSDVLKLVSASKQEGDLFWRQVVERLTFPEISETGLGFAKATTGGSGIGPGLAAQLARIAKQIIDAGIKDPDIFDLIGLLQENIGPDRISDMTALVLKDHLLKFSQRVAKELQVGTTEMVGREGTTFYVPCDPESKRPILLVPRDVLRPMPVAHSWDDIDRVAAHNADLRRRVNKRIGGTWKKATSQKVGKEKLRATLLEYPELIRDLLTQYREKPARPYDFERDADAVLLWEQLATQFAAEQPLALTRPQHWDDASLRDVVRKLVDRFKNLVEHNRYARLLYNDDGKPRKEKIAQLAFFGIADVYCEANNLDISPEADAGVGPVDFKISHGYRYRITVELKLSSNQNLLSGFEQQLPAYQKAEKAVHSIYLVIQNGDHTKRLKQLVEIRRAALNAERRVPDLIIVDGRRQLSASKRRTRR